MPYLSSFEDFVKVNQLVKSSLSSIEAAKLEKVRDLEWEIIHPVLPSWEEVSKWVLGLTKPRNDFESNPRAGEIDIEPMKKHNRLSFKFG